MNFLTETDVPYREIESQYYTVLPEFFLGFFRFTVKDAD